MIRFLIQTIDNEIIHDFAFHLKEAVKYNNWYYNEKKYSYKFCENLDNENYIDYIPIGSINFVLDYYKKYYNINNISPINIPQELFKSKYLGRNIYNALQIKENKIDINKKVFVKEINKFKGYTDITQIKYIPENIREYLVSDIIDIKSEWRTFVFNKKIIDLKNYDGKFDLIPDMKNIENMIMEYKNSPKAYTIDVAVIDNINQNKTVLLEIHQFFSCGLYGFCDYNILPKMFIATHKEIIQSK